MLYPTELREYFIMTLPEFAGLGFKWRKYHCSKSHNSLTVVN